MDLARGGGEGGPELLHWLNLKYGAAAAPVEAEVATVVEAIAHGLIHLRDEVCDVYSASAREDVYIFGCESEQVGGIHRDIKPENVVCDWDDRLKLRSVKVVDFGAARLNVTHPDPRSCKEAMHFLSGLAEGGSDFNSFITRSSLVIPKGFTSYSNQGFTSDLYGSHGVC